MDLPRQEDHADYMFFVAFNHAAIGMALVSTEGRWLRVNPALCSLLGYSSAELLKVGYQFVTHPDDLESDLDQMQELLAGRITGYELEKRYIGSAGNVVQALLT
jgi:PAS domain S-box-containing protein